MSVLYFENWVSKYNRFDRRTAIKGIGGLLAGGISATSAAASASKDSVQHSENKENTRFNSELSVENGRVVVTDEGASQSTSKQFGQANSKIELDSESIAVFLNNGVEQGHFNVYEESGTVMVEPTISSGEIQPQGVINPECGDNHTNWNITPTKKHVKIKMDHDLTERVVLMLAGGAALSAVAGTVLSVTCVGSVAAPVAAIVAAALGFAGTAISTTDDGCGVVITYTDYSILPPTGDFYPQ